MTQEEVLRDMLDRLEEVDIAYMVVGSIASNLWGMPRATQDADVVVDLDESRLNRFLAAAAPTYYIPEGIARAALPAGSMFNAICWSRCSRK